jgi:hypothetical protein
LSYKIIARKPIFFHAISDCLHSLPVAVKGKTRRRPASNQRSVVCSAAINPRGNITAYSRLSYKIVARKHLLANEAKPRLHGREALASEETNGINTLR